MRIVTKSEMIIIENQSKNDYLISEEMINENVGVSGAHFINQLIRDHEINYEVLFLIGKGRNGADGVAMARHLANQGIKTRAFVLFNESELCELLKTQLKIAKQFGVAINYIENTAQVTSYVDQMGLELVIDAIFGAGVQLPLSNEIHEVIDVVNDNASFVLAIDIPTGVDIDTGLIQGNAIDATYTLAVGFPKLGQYVSDGAKHSGEIFTLDAGFPRELENEGDKFLLRPKYMIDLVSDRDKFADKKSFGHTLVLGGSHGLTGAPILTAMAAIKSGAGLVTAATWQPQYQELLARLGPEIMTGYLPIDYTTWGPLIKGLNKYSCIVIGPGLGRSSRARRLVLEVLNNFDGPVVIDADAINVLTVKEDRNVFKLRSAPTVLTPHFGEFAKFSGVGIEELKLKPVTYLKELVNTINCSVVLKGPCTYLGCSDGSVYFNYFPNDGMATGGTGDVLAGLLGGLLSQEKVLNSTDDKLINRYDVFNREIAVGIYLHSIAGKFAAERLGVRSMTAMAIIDSFSDTFNRLDKDFDEVLGGI